MKNSRLLSLFCLTFLFFTSCEDPKTNDPIIPNLVYDKGVFIVNEGTFGANNGSIDFLDTDSNKLTKSVYSSSNDGETLGDVVQSMTRFQGKGYIVVNNSGLLYVTNLTNLKKEAKITGFSSPRYFVGINQLKGYVSDWFADEVKIIDLLTKSVVGTIETGAGPNEMLYWNNKVFVCNSGAFGNDSTISVIDTKNDQVVKTFYVGDKPTAIRMDQNENIWVLCSGKYDDYQTAGVDESTIGYLVKIDPINYTVLRRIPLNGANHPVKLAINTNLDKLFYLSDEFTGNVNRISITDTVEAANSFIQGSFYGLGIDPTQNIIYASDAKDFSQAGLLKRYAAEDGSLIDTFSTGITPNGISN